MHNLVKSSWSLHALAFLTGKKCTYGIKCKFYHPERINQPQRSLADELRANARLSPTRSTSAKEEKKGKRGSQAELLCSVPTESDKSSLQKVSAERKSLAHKAKASDIPLQAKGCVSGSVSPDRYQQPHMDSLSYISQERLDSGIGSLENQLSDMWPHRCTSHCDHSHAEQVAVCTCGRQRPVYPHSPSLEQNGLVTYKHGSHKSSSPCCCLDSPESLFSLLLMLQMTRWNLGFFQCHCSTTIC